MLPRNFSAVAPNHFTIQLSKNASHSPSSNPAMMRQQHVPQEIKPMMQGPAHHFLRVERQLKALLQKQLRRFSKRGKSRQITRNDHEVIGKPSITSPAHKLRRIDIKIM
jgi:hypothetical protein